jgi:hypothetical protein
MEKQKAQSELTNLLSDKFQETALTKKNPLHFCSGFFNHLNLSWLTPASD